MAESTGIHGYGTTLSGATTGIVVEVTNVSFGDTVTDQIDISNMDSDNSYREFIAGMLDAGEITLTCNYNKTQTAAFRTNQDTKAKEVWTITLPDSSTFVCSGFISSVGTPIPFDDKVTQDVTIKLSGKPTFTASV